MRSVVLGLAEVSRPGASDPDVQEVRLDHEPEAVPSARRQFMADLEQRLLDRAEDGSSDVVTEAAVVLSELLGNAVTHARELPDGGVVLRWQVHGGFVDLAVTDGGGSGNVRPAKQSLWSVHGRGLRIVRSLARDWGVREDSDGRRTVWAVLGGSSARSSTA